MRLVHDQVLGFGDTVLDYGCGFGGDVERLRKSGFDAIGYDPYYAPSTQLRVSHVVTLLFVIDVIEDEAERAAVLRQAWWLCSKHLIVAVRQDGETRVGTPLNDGFKNRRTFQRGWSQPEFRAWVEQTLNQQTYRLGDGVSLISKRLDLVEKLPLRARGV